MSLPFIVNDVRLLRFDKFIISGSFTLSMYNVLRF